ncbi:carboxypeptidase-like regulatory domain-containing protein, partial [Sinomicrobium weinanense]
MRTYLFFAVFLTYTVISAQQFPYDREWKKIEKQEREGKLKSLLPAVNKIYKAAKREGNATQRIRAVLYRGKIVVITDDGGEEQLQAIRDFEAEIASASGPEKNILQSMLAETLYSYYQGNRWIIEERARVKEATTEDFRFWSENIFDERITALYLRSLENAGELKAQTIEKWDNILENREWRYVYNRQKEDKNEGLKSQHARGRELRPALYDLLVYRAIGFFRDQPEIFFNRFITEDEAGPRKEKVLGLLRDLADFHREKGHVNAQLYNELEILKARKEEYTAEKYINKLEKLSRTAPSAWYNGEVLLELARFYREQEDREDTDDLQAKKKWCDNALALVAKIEKDYAKTHAVREAIQLRQDILSRTFSIRVESYVPSGQYNPMSVTHKNLEHIYFRVLRYHPNLNDFFGNPTDKIRYAKDEDRQKVLDEMQEKYPLEKEFSISLRSFDDYQDHTTTVALEALPPGSYIVLAANTPDFKVESEGFALQSQLVNVTDYTIVSNGKEVLVTGRQSGHPEAGKTVEVYERDSKKLNMVKTLTTDASGKSVAAFDKQGRSQQYYRIKGEDVFYNHSGYYSGVDYERQTTHHTRFFTDRSIYRPGQTVYFKAIRYKQYPDGRKEVVEKEKLNIELSDLNKNILGTLELTTNRFGSVSGEFVLPTGGITGIYILKDDPYNRYTFSVEEYKRPRFEVIFDTIKEIFRLDEEITAHGKAQAYSGASIDNAKVTYRVYRKPIYPYLPWWRRQSIRQEPREEITHGETMTDAKGNFKIPFEAKTPSRPASVKKEKEPRTYTYIIETDITDINGETRSGSQSITVGDLRYTLGLDIPSRVEWEALKNITLHTENLNGQFAPAKGKLTLARIVPPDRVLRENPLQDGDYKLYDRAAFVKMFPHDPYAKEDKKENWPQEDPVIAVNFDTEKENKIRVKPRRKWKEGYYLLKGHILDGQDTIPAEKLVYLYKKEKKHPVNNELFSVMADKESYNPGDEAKVTFASAAPNATVIAELEYDGEIVKREELEINNDVGVFSFPVKESYRGNVYVHYYFGKYNTARQGSVTIAVPFEENKLKVTAGTMRDKLRPGDEENWELTISGEGKDAFLAKFATEGAEVLATMYDASLDQFKPHNINWSPYHLLSRSSGYRNWNLNMAYGTTRFSRIFRKNLSLPGSIGSPLFDRVNWFGFDINGRNAQNSYVHRLNIRFNLEKILKEKTQEVEEKIKKDKRYIGGAVIDEEGDPLPGVNVMIQGTTTGIVTDFDGIYTIEAVPGDVLVFNYIGRERRTIAVTSGTRIFNVVMEEDLAILDEVVITGYGESRLMAMAESPVADQYSNVELGGPGIESEPAPSAPGEGEIDEAMEVQPRRALQETAFFFPHLKTDREGSVKISFTTP